MKAHSCPNGQFLREERRRLGLTQGALAAAGQVSVKSQILYEAGRRQPNLDYLRRIAQLGVDVHFVTTGTRAEFEFVQHADIDLIVSLHAEVALLNRGRLVPLSDKAVTAIVRLVYRYCRETNAPYPSVAQQMLDAVGDVA